jgi:four helix bundle protein
MVIRDFKDLDAWKQAMQVCQLVYRLTATLPNDERFGLTSQMRRAAVSIPSNIAEGHGRHSRGEFLQFIGYARGSLGELETQALFCQDLGQLSPQMITPLIDEVSRLKRILAGLRNALVPADDRRLRDEAAPDTQAFPGPYDPNPQPPTPEGQ